MPRIYIPDIPDDVVNLLITLESTKAWVERLEVAERRLEEELQEIKTVLKFVVYPTYNRLIAEQMHQDRINKEVGDGPRDH